MAYLRDRRAFGNIGTRKFRGARFGDPLSPRGPQYTKDGRVLDYSTDVGPFTIVDQSGEGNTATLYSGRGLTMDGVGDLIDFGSPTFSEPVTSMTGYARSTDTSINLGLTSATLAGNDTWETFSADTAAKDYGDSLWFNGTDTKVNTGLNVSATTPTELYVEATVIVSDLLGIQAFVSQNNANQSVFEIRSLNGKPSFGMADSGGLFSSITSSDDIPLNVPVVIRGEWNGSTKKIFVDGVEKGSTAQTSINGSATTSAYVGSRPDSSKLAEGLIYAVSINDQSGAVLAYTGLSPTPWTDTIGSNDGTPSGTFVTAAQHFTNPDFILGTGYNGDLSNVRCLGATGTVLGHWSLADWSNPSGNTSNGKTVVDSGPNKLHGTCTGCSGFTGEGIDPEVAGIVGYDDAQWFNGTDADVEIGTGDSLGFNGSAKIEWRGYIYVTGTAPLSASKNALATFVNGGSAGFSVSLNAANTLRVAGRSVSTDSFQNYVVAISNGLHYVKCYADFTNDEFGISIDEAAYTTQSATFANNTYTFGSSTNPTQIGAADSNNRWDSTLTDILILKDDVATNAYTGRGSNPWADTIGSNDGTPSGTFVTVGQKRATIPQTADKNWNKRVGLGQAGQATLFPYTTLTPVPFGFDATQSSGTSIAGFTLPSTAQIGDSFKIRLDITSDQSPTCQFRVSNANVNVASNSLPLSVGHNEITLTVTAACDFIAISEGDSPSTITVRNFTAELISGTAQASVMVSASDANDQIDALGTAILEPRLNTQQLNLFGEGEYSRTPVSASLDLTTTATWELWGNFYGDFGIDKGFFSKYDAGNSKRSWLIYQNDSQEDGQLSVALSGNGTTTSLSYIPVPDELAQVAITLAGGVLRGYVNGSEVTVTQVGANSPPASLYVSDIPVLIGSAGVGSTSFAERKIGSAKIYNVALTADEVLTNYNTQKSKYGL